MWVDPDGDPRSASRKADGERAMLIDYLRGYRLTMEMKCADLDAGQMARRSVPPSTMSLLGLDPAHGRRGAELVPADDGGRARAVPATGTTLIPDVDWSGAVADPKVVAEAWQAWRDEVAFAEQFVANSASLDRRGVKSDGKPVSLRRIIVHMIEEYARHCGHADLLRERIDGRVGQ